MAYTGPPETQTSSSRPARRAIKPCDHTPTTVPKAKAKSRSRKAKKPDPLDYMINASDSTASTTIPTKPSGEYVTRGEFEEMRREYDRRIDQMEKDFTARLSKLTVELRVKTNSPMSSTGQSTSAFHLDASIDGVGTPSDRLPKKRTAPLVAVQPAAPTQLPDNNSIIKRYV